MSDALHRVFEAVRDDGGLLGATAVAPGSDAERHFGELVAGGPRAGAEHPWVVEAVREGHLLHHGRARVALTDDPDLALLAGDRLYALGLSRLAELGDLDAVRELSDVISLSAMACAGGDPDLAQAAWEAGTTAVGWGGSDELEAAKQAARAGLPSAASALRAAARQLRAEVAS